MAQTAANSKLANVLGEKCELAYGVAGGSGTTTTVTIPQLRTVKGVLVGGATSSTAPYCDTVSTNTFTATHGSADLFAYIAWGDPIA